MTTDTPAATDLTHFVEEHRDALVAAVVSITKLPRPDAEDIAQEVLLQAAERGVPTTAPDDTFRWLRRVACNRAWKQFGRAYSRLVMPCADLPEPGRYADTGAPEPEAALLAAERARAVRAALETLPPHYREVLLRRYVEDQPPRQIAEELALPVTLVKSRLQRAAVQFAREFRRAGLVVVALTRLLRRRGGVSGTAALNAAVVVVMLDLAIGLITPPERRVENFHADVRRPPAAGVGSAGAAAGSGPAWAGSGERGSSADRLTVRRGHGGPELPWWEKDDMGIGCTPDPATLAPTDRCVASYDPTMYPEGDMVEVPFPEPIKQHMPLGSLAVWTDEVPLCDFVPTVEPVLTCTRYGDPEDPDAAPSTPAPAAAADAPR